MTIGQVRGYPELMRAPITLACAATLLLACGEPTGTLASTYHVAISPDKTSYSLSTDSSAYVTITNHSDRPVFLPMDSYVVYERLVDGQWRDAYAWFVVDGIGRSFPIATGTSHTDELQLWFYLANRPGTYRFRYFAYADSAGQQLLPLKERVSPSFKLQP